MIFELMMILSKPNLCAEIMTASFVILGHANTLAYGRYSCIQVTEDSDAPTIRLLWLLCGPM